MFDTGEEANRRKNGMTEKEGRERKDLRKAIDITLYVNVEILEQLINGVSIIWWDWERKQRRMNEEDESVRVNEENKKKIQSRKCALSL